MIFYSYTLVSFTPRYLYLRVHKDPEVKGKTNPSLLLLLSFWVPSGPIRKGSKGSLIGISHLLLYLYLPNRYCGMVTNSLFPYGTVPAGTRTVSPIRDKETVPTYSLSSTDGWDLPARYCKEEL
jgi:hypothetical protein